MLLGCCLLSTIVIIAFPKLDILIAKLFYNNGFFLKDSLWVQFLYHSVPLFSALSILSLLLIWIINRTLANGRLYVTGRHFVFAFLVFGIGSGLIVNTLLKGNFGRARPRDIVEFNGTKQFSPAFVISDQVGKNSSFSSGHAAAAFFSLVLACFFRRKKRAFAVAMIYGGAVSLARMAAGGHFFSDNLVSFFIMAITTDLLYYALISQAPALLPSPELELSIEAAPDLVLNDP